MEKEEVLMLFKDMNIISFSEIERDGKTGLGKFKHWHTFEVVAQKSNNV